MSRYFMALPSTDEKTCEHAIKWIRNNYPYVVAGFTESYSNVDWSEYDYTSIVWYSDDEDDYNSSFMFWGHHPIKYDIVVPFPSYDDIGLGEL